MANRLLAHRLVADLQNRRRGLRASSYSLAEVSRRLLHCLARQRASGSPAARAWTDYDLAVRAGVSRKQTAELYEEIGLALLVREALDGLRERGLITVDRSSPSGPYRGFAATEQGAALVDVRPWYRRLLAFFDPPAETPSRREPKP